MGTDFVVKDYSSNINDINPANSQAHIVVSNLAVMIILMITYIVLNIIVVLIACKLMELIHCIVSKYQCL